jgi:hypothetical protein
MENSKHLKDLVTSMPCRRKNVIEKGTKTAHF